jgi:ABC-2 type transport system ATP-binding protein
MLRRLVGQHPMSAAAIAVEGLHVAYGNTRALVDVDVDVAPGSTLGVLGHNGAGKTTFIRVLTTLVRPDAGRVLVDGFDVVRHADEVRQRIGVTGQYAGLDDFLTGRENLELLGRLAGLRQAAHSRAGELIERLGLEDLAERRVGEMSGGSRRRVDLAASLVASPNVLILDEPTTGLDPIARAALWDVVDELTTTGTTVVLTTQYLHEADRLADDILVLAHGRVVARGEPTALKRIVGDKIITATIPATQVDRLLRSPQTQRSLSHDRVNVSFTAADAATAADVVADLGRLGDDIADLSVTSPSLDDVFAHLTSTGVGT